MTNEAIFLLRLLIRAFDNSSYYWHYFWFGWGQCVKKPSQLIHTKLTNKSNRYISVSILKDNLQSQFGRLPVIVVPVEKVNFTPSFFFLHGAFAFTVICQI